MRNALLSIFLFLVFVLAGCAGGSSAPTTTSKMEEIPLTHEEMVATRTNTIIVYEMPNGDHGKSVFGSDGSVKSTYYYGGSSESDVGSVTLPKDNIACLKWKKWPDDCWADYKVADNQYVGHEQGGKKRTSKWRVMPGT